MFCRYCGSHIADDSRYCSKCGKNLGQPRYARIERLVQKLRLRTPYPYFGLLLVFFAVWAVGPRQSHADYSGVRWSFELDRELNLPAENLFQQSLSLVVENTGQTEVRDIPIELTATIEPRKPAAVEAGFLGRRLLIMQNGQPLPLTIVLADPISPGQKRRYLLDGRIEVEPPFKLTWEVREEGESTVLASHTVQP
jgi:hypothetical protein